MKIDSLEEIRQGLKDGQLLPSDLYRHFSAKIEAQNKTINAFREINDSWHKEALEADKRWQTGKPLSQYDGVPVAIKDNIATTNMKTCAGSKMLARYQSPYDATVISKLKASGLILAGKSNMDEFAMGSSTETCYFGKTLNPHDHSKVPGGSSGGSAAAVSAGFVPLALGSDTGGSIRQPASFCGTVGFKPSYGAVSRYGLLAMASSLDQIGTLSRNVDDTISLFDTIVGQDRRDATTKPIHKRLKDESLDTITIGYDPTIIEGGLDAPTQTVFDELIKKLEVSKKIKLRKIKIEYLQQALATYYIIMPAEVSSNLARFDGIKYGHSEQAGNISDIYLASRTGGFGEEVKRRILLGTYVLSAGYYDAYYAKAQAVRNALGASLAQSIAELDAILLPTAPTVAFGFAEKTADPLQMYLSDIYTVIANLAQMCAISLPVMKTGQLPVGVQLIGAQGRDYHLLSVAKQMEEMLNG